MLPGCETPFIQSVDLLDKHLGMRLHIKELCRRRTMCMDKGGVAYLVDNSKHHCLTWNKLYTVYYIYIPTQLCWLSYFIPVMMPRQPRGRKGVDESIIQASTFEYKRCHFYFTLSMNCSIAQLHQFFRGRTPLRLFRFLAGALYSINIQGQIRTDRFQIVTALTRGDFIRLSHWKTWPMIP